jgi:hypothetical protein
MRIIERRVCLVRALLFHRVVRSKAWIYTFGILAITIASCGVETTYVPRTPHTLALGMRNAEPAVYKDGVLTMITKAPEQVVACSRSAAAEVRQATSQFASYKTNARIGGIFNALGVFAPPMYFVGIYFGIRATDHQQKANVHVVDTINRHNDEIGCVPR